MSELTAVSLCAGVEGFGLALERCGVKVIASVESDPDCRGVIARHFPGSRLFDDVRTVTGDDLRAAGFVPERGIVTGGWPCQDLSIAGRRAGLGGARSGLFWQVVRLADELRPRWLVLENVPGLLSAVCCCPGDGSCTANSRAVRCGRWDKRDGKRVWLDHVQHIPPDGACPGGCMAVHGGAMGTVVGALERLGYGLCWRVLDSRFWNVPQRRERVFIVGCLGDGAAPVEVLLEPESGEGNPAPGGKAGADAAGTADGSADGARTVGTIGTSGPGGGWRLGADEAAAGQLVPVAAPLTTRPYADEAAAESRLVVAATLQGGGKRGHRIDAEGAAGGHLVPFDTAQITSSENRANPQQGDPNRNSRVHVAGIAHETSPAITAHHGKGPDSDATNGIVVTHALTSEGADASEDGTGRGTPLVTYALGSHAATDGAVSNESHDGGGPVGTNISREIAYSLRAERTQAIAATLTSGRATGQGVNPPGGRQEDDQNLVPMAFNPQTGGSAGRIGYGETPTALQASQVTGDQAGTAVRRLTPLETERLQALPDEWTRWKLVNGQLVELSDSARYRMVGNAVTTSVPEWIIGRIVAVDARLNPVRSDAEAGAA